MALPALPPPAPISGRAQQAWHTAGAAAVATGGPAGSLCGPGSTRASVGGSSCGASGGHRLDQAPRLSLRIQQPSLQCSGAWSLPTLTMTSHKLDWPSVCMRCLCSHLHAPSVRALNSLVFTSTCSTYLPGTLPACIESHVRLQAPQELRLPSRIV